MCLVSVASEEWPSVAWKAPTFFMPQPQLQRRAQARRAFLVHNVTINLRFLVAAEALTRKSGPFYFIARLLSHENGIHDACENGIHDACGYAHKF